MEEIGKLLPAIFKSQIRRADPPLLEILTPLWPRVAGKAIAEYSRPIVFTGGRLTLGCSCPCWTAQLRQMSEEIRAKINGFLGSAIVKTLKVRHVPDLAPLESAGEKQAGRAEPGTEEPSRPDGLPPEGSGPQDGAAELGPEISEILDRSFAKYFARRGKRVD